MPETFCFQANRESERRRPRPIFLSTEANDLAIQILASYPPSGKEKGYEAQPSGGVSAHYLHYDSDIHTPDPTNALRTAVPGR